MVRRQFANSPRIKISLSNQAIKNPHQIGMIIAFANRQFIKPH
jgi:hypothetical protein